MGLEDVYLEHIRLHLQSGDPDNSLLRTLVNSWFAHHKGAPFVRDGHPLWLSDEGSRSVLAGQLHAISVAAKAALAEGRLKDLVIDHTIPSSVIRQELKIRHAETPFDDLEDLRAFLKRHFTLALLTKHEHNVQLKRYKSKMARDWKENFATDPGVRYCRYSDPDVAIDFEIQHAHAD